MRYRTVAFGVLLAFIAASVAANWVGAADEKKQTPKRKAKPAAKVEPSGKGLGVTAADRFTTPPGFVTELVYEVPGATQGSWVSLAVDPQGRLVACDQEGGFFRIDVSGDEPKVEPLAIDLGGAQGLLFAFGSLYANLNTPKHPSGIWRLTDTDGDDQFDKKEHLVEMNAAGEHGPHAMILSPDGERIIFCAGNNTVLPKNIARTRVPRVWDEDHLLGRMPDARGHNANRLAPGGFVASMKPDGSDIELVATGFRNHYDIALNRENELFTFDADMEWDLGTPWYRPTRVNHVISGAEFGWRNGTGKWPAYYPDSFGASVNIGPGSPTGICFGYGSNFPKKYQDALFIGDWSYGNIYAVHLSEDGASYSGSYETFATAAPLPITDLVVRPQDGMLYFTIGGRSTQSALYRFRYTGDAAAADKPGPETAEASAKQSPAQAEQLRSLRHELEALHLAPASDDAVKMAIQNLGHSDRAIAFAARIALEHQPVASWRSLVESLPSPQAKALATIALARTGEASDRESAMRTLGSIEWKGLSSQHRIDLLRAYALVSMRLGAPSEAESQKLASNVIDQFPTPDNRVNRELAQWLVYLNAPAAVEKIVSVLGTVSSQEDQIHYAMTLRGATAGWTPELRRGYLQWFRDIQSARGGMSFGGFIANIKADHVKRLPTDVQEELAALIEEPKDKSTEDTSMPPRPFVKQWTVDELVPVVTVTTRKPNFERGQEMFAATQCFKCHRMDIQGGILGPDLTGAGGRFSPRDLLVSIIEPSKVVSDQYGATQFLTDDGRVIVGRVVNMAGRNLKVMTNMLDPSSLVDLDRSKIEETSVAPNSMMPTGLIDTLNADEVFDLIAYIRSGGNPEHTIYTSAPVAVTTPQAEDVSATAEPESDLWITFPGGEGAGAGKHVVLISGDEEYRSEEALPQLAKMLSTHHGFRTTVLFAIDPKSGEVDPKQSRNIPGLETLATADLMVIATRFRNLPDDQMKHVVDYVEAGKPVIGLRTATHAFNISQESSYAKYSWNNGGEEYNGGFGRQVLGETWVAHHGNHKSEATRGVVVDPSHAIVKGIEPGQIFGPTDVYRVRLPLPGDSHVVVDGQILKGMNENDEPVTDDRNNPMMPIAWTRTYKGGRVFTTTMGAATDLPYEGVRRMIVNAAFWCVGLEEKVTPDLDVSIVGDFKPTAYGFDGFQKGKRPSDFK